ncbi:glycosyltransferase family 2 protein [uncultured Lutibacter sp.]|uniref:glycosyltransferase family 2 protein n=1 Tax=uncultured Lutibacter sp. TaxID=437739 RepID=UPI00263645BA|nr:glycosyltransferase family 2 protein [uncultured Lutibacter sp.]
MKLVTVFTPTYNRAYCLHQLYDSLVQQTSTNFYWLIIDDGSIDNTEELVASWIKEDKVEIQYIFQENQGMHGAHNTAYSLIKTELNVCIDSDDFMPDNAIELIENTWESIQNKEAIAGLIGYDIFKDATPIGKAIPKTIKQTTLTDLYKKHQIPGDKKLVFRTEVVNKFPKYPIFKGERFVPLGILYLMIDQKYELVCIPEPLCVVEYLEDGSSLNMLKQYINNPKGFAFSRNIRMKYAYNLKDLIKNAIHYVSSNLIIGKSNFIKKSESKLITVLVIPFGLLLYMYIMIKVKLLNFKSK